MREKLPKNGQKSADFLLGEATHVRGGEWAFLLSLKGKVARSAERVLTLSPLVLLGVLSLRGTARGATRNFVNLDQIRAGHGLK